MRLTPQQALPKIMHYCAWQERSHYDTREKLFSYGLYGDDVEEIMARLIEENYLNEERYATQYAGGKFRINGWGRIKIVAGLKFKKVSTYNINVAIRSLDETEYLEKLRKLAHQKWAALKGEQYINRQAKTTNYLLQKGYESTLIRQVINELREKNKTSE